MAVVINVGPDRSLRVGGGLSQTAGGGDVGKGSVAIISQQRFALRKLPGAAQHENIQAAVVIVIALNHVQTAELVAEPGLRRTVGECAVAVVVKVMQGSALPEIGGDHVK